MTYDTTKPNSARIYDYWLGGTHNFPVDRVVGDRAAEALPMAIQAVKLNRWFLFYAIEQLTKAGLTCYIDLATGLPTQGYLHERVPETVKIIYNDIDPETIAYAREVIGDRLNIRYIESRLEDIDRILAVAETFFGTERRIGICIVGVAYFIPDDDLRRVFQRLYEWSAPGSQLAISSFDVAQTDEWRNAVSDYERNTGLTIYPRSREHMLALAHPWQPDARGLQPYEVYVEEELQRKIIPPGEKPGQLGYGGILLR